MEGDPVLNKHFPDVKVVFRIPGEPVDFINNKSINLAFILPTILNGPQKLSSMGRFCGSAFLPEYFQDFDAFVLAIGTTKLILVFQGCAFNLFVT